MSEEQNSKRNAAEGTGDVPSNQTSSPTAPKVISLSIKDLMILHTAYMPFVAHGGLFIPTKKAFNMGDVLSLMISLMDDPTKYSVDGKVIWITPSTSNNRTPGIGVQFIGPCADDLSKKIQNYLMAFGKNNETTNTM
jgi:type IV pilus assembly protein PilZ